MTIYWCGECMYTVEERRNKILEELKIKDKVYVKVLTEQFGVAIETIRRDMDVLAAESKIKKIFGGAIKVKSPPFELLYNERAVYNLKTKRIIAAEAAILIEGSDTVSLLEGHHRTNVATAGS